MNLIKKIFNRNLLTTEEKILKDQNKFIRTHKKDVYDFFGYLGEGNNELPKFFIKEKHPQKYQYISDFFTPFTPKLLQFCFDHASKDLLEELNYDIQSYKKMCNEIKNGCKYNTPEWDEVIKNTINSLKEYYKEQV